MKLKDLKVGDVMVIHDANRRGGPQMARVRSVGRKYVYCNLMWLKGFDRETGRMAGNGVGNVHALTEEAEKKRVEVRSAKLACQKLGVTFEWNAKPEVVLACAKALESLERGA